MQNCMDLSSLASVVHICDAPEANTIAAFVKCVKLLQTLIYSHLPKNSNHIFLCPIFFKYVLCQYSVISLQV